ncbi:C40 family peptidase [Tumebacillus lipolyticus]|uniref:C40 family peptidase n=1 Tax=Tumebacillus lipolyticus TaxID=1280370 RepID=A0ABW5A0L4_9BACL
MKKMFLTLTATALLMGGFSAAASAEKTAPTPAVTTTTDAVVSVVANEGISSYYPNSLVSIMVTGSQIVTTARAQIGKNSGWDCSAFTQYVFNQHGISLPRVSADQATFGTAVAKSSLQPGDLVFFHSTVAGKSGVTHVGIYSGNDKMIHCPGTGDLVKEVEFITNSYWAPKYNNARRAI